MVETTLHHHLLDTAGLPLGSRAPTALLHGPEHPLRVRGRLHRCEPVLQPPDPEPPRARLRRAVRQGRADPDAGAGRLRRGFAVLGTAGRFAEA